MEKFLRPDELYPILCIAQKFNDGQLARLFGRSPTWGTGYMREIQDWKSARDKIPAPTDYVTNKDILDYQGWTLDELERRALPFIAAMAGQRGA